MRITEEQLDAYQSQGYLLLDGLLSQAEVELMKAQLPAIWEEDTPARVLEKESRIVRSVYGSHKKNEVFRLLSLHPRLVEPVMQILDGDVYVHQFKINAKLAFGGDIWQWHQDYVFWRKEDGMPTDRIMNVAIFLDEVCDYNGPLLFMSGSQQEGMIDTQARAITSASVGEPLGQRPWLTNLTADLKYSLDAPTVTRLADKYRIVSQTGRAGSVLFFNSNIVHASLPNITPYDRVIIIVSFNSIDNRLPPTANPRPDFLADRTYQRVVPVADDALLRANGTAL